MDAIGGYFELAKRENGIFPHRGGALLNTGRNALEYILLSLDDASEVWLPYFTCEVVLEPIVRLGIRYRYYHTDSNFEIVEDIRPGKGQYIIANNYFGIKDEYIASLSHRLGDALIVDSSQALFAPRADGMKIFYSCRKFVGVADGGVAFGPGLNDVTSFEEDDTPDHDNHLLIRLEKGAEVGFPDYQRNERMLNGRTIRRMSSKTLDILDHIDYGRIRTIRRDNFAFLHAALKDENPLDIPSMSSFDCPMVYPFVCKDADELRKKLSANRIYVARYWPNVVRVNGFEAEAAMSEMIVPLPVDQRYGEAEMSRILEILK